MKLPCLALFWWLGLSSTLAMADPCVKVRQGEGEGCMRFSPAEQRHAAQYGLRLAAPFKANRQALLKQGWVRDQEGPSEAGGAADDSGVSCGSGWDAVCQSAFRRGGEVLLLTLSGVNAGMPLVGIEVSRADPPAAGLARTLTTASFIVRIEPACPPGQLGCADVAYRGTSRTTGKSIALSGKTLASQGYEFWNGKTCYRVLHDGRLTVTQHGKVLLDEKGSWQ